MLTKKLFTLFIFLAIGITPFLSCISVSSADSMKSQNSEQKPWTYMFYADGDWAGGFPLVDYWLVPSGMSSSENLNIIVLQDTPDDTATMWYLNEPYNATLLEELGEINMGNYTTLRDFITYSKNNYPAERYMINLWDHGGAWVGACWDVTNNNDHLTMDEIQKALMESSGVNIIGFTACEMGCIEAAYELRNCTDVYIGSEEAYGISPDWIEIAQFIDENPDETTYAIANELISIFKENKPYYGNIDQWKFVLLSLIKLDLPFFPSLTLSAVRTDKLEALALSIDAFAHVLIDDINVYKTMITRVRFRVDNYPYPLQLRPGSIIGSQIDLYHFVELMDKPRYRLLRPELHKAAQLVKNNLEETIFIEHHQFGHRNANGLSIYFPPFYRYYSPEYTNSSLDFTEDTCWDEFLETYRLN